MTKYADKILYKYGGAFHIGVISNESITEQLILAPAVIARQKELLIHEITNLDSENLIELSTSPLLHIKTHEIAGSMTTPNTHFALIDGSNPLHIRDTIIHMQTACDYFGSNISFQYCDFFTCEKITRQIGIVKFMNPIFLLIRRMIIKVPNGQQILDPPRNVAVLFVAAPRMQMYSEAKRNAWIVMKALEKVEAVRFFEFNPHMENVSGLSLTSLDMPQIFVWPATKERNGGSFTACDSG